MDDGQRPVPPAQRLRTRAAATDRHARFDERLERVDHRRRRRVARRRGVRAAGVVLGALAGSVAPTALAAMGLGVRTDAAVVLAAAVVGGVLALVLPEVREAVAARRGPRAWDWRRQRHVLIGDPSREVEGADRRGGGHDPRPGPDPRRMR